MSITTTTRSAGPFVGDGVTVALPFSFKVFAGSDLRVERTSAAGVTTTLALSTHYTVVLNADQDVAPGGVATLLTPLALGESAIITSAVPATQPLQLRNGGPFLARAIENALDRLMIVLQQFGANVGQMLRSASAETLAPIPSAPERTGRLLAFDATTGQPRASAFTETQLASAVAAAYAAGSTADAVTYQPAGTGAVARSVQHALRQSVSVQDFGADPTGIADSHAAFAAAWAAIKSTGGGILIPPGRYMLNATWVLDVDQDLPHLYAVTGYGAELLAGPAVTGHAIRVFRGYNNFGVAIEGLQFNHRNNATVGGCIQSQGAANLRIVRCSVEHHNTKAGYSGIELGPHTVGDIDSNTFWALIDGWTSRMRSGGDGTPAAVGVRFKGVANATNITNCSFGGVVDAIRFETDGVAGGLANGCAVLHNAFEGVTNAIYISTAAPAAAMITGLRVYANRVESTGTFVRIAGALVADSGYPPVLEGNYLTVGSVDDYLINPNGQIVFTNEPSYFGVLPAENYMGGPAGTRVICEGVGRHLEVSNFSGVSSWAQAHLVIGGRHIWFDSSDKLRFKAGAPTSDTDGTVIGTQT